METGRDDAGTERDEAPPLFLAVPGGAALIRYFGRIPDFDGPEIFKLVLDRDGYSVLHVHARIPAGAASPDGGFSPELHAAVAFILDEIVDLRLDEFHAWSQLDRLTLRRAPDRPTRGERTGPNPASDDIEIELVPRSWRGGPGLIRARVVEIEMEPGKPARSFRDSGDASWLPALVRSALADAWDPLAVGTMGGGGVYARHVPELVELVSDATVPEGAIVAHLARIEIETMGLSLPPAKRVRGARALLGLRDGRRPGAGRVVRQWSDADGSLCLRIVETRDGRYAHEQRVYRVDGDGERAWWEDVGTGRSGLFETADAAEREARRLACWIGSGDATATGP